MSRPPYDQSLRPLARRLRKQMPKTERRLWAELRRKQRGYVFNRQFIIRRYVVDFYCRRLRLVIEVDGITHAYPEVALHDETRQRELEACGLTVLRFPSWRIAEDLDRVLDEIDACIAQLAERQDSHSDAG